MQPSKSNASGRHALKITWVGDNVTPKSLVPLSIKLEPREKTLQKKAVEKGGGKENKKKRKKRAKLKKPIGRFLFNLFVLT